MPEGELLDRLASESNAGSRYETYGEIASGGMASVQYGRLIGPRGFSRAVAVKRLHPHFAKEPEFVTMFVDEARLSARLLHANIIHTLDVIETPGEVALVMEYVHGETLWTLLRAARSAGQPVPIQVGCALVASVLHGLHAAHEARGDAGQPLQIVHRDVSPQNILIGCDGIPRVLDFGIAKALGRLRSTPSGEIKGKLGYIAREQLQAQPVDRRTDVYGASVVLWEVLTGAPLFDGPSESAIVHSVLYDVVAAPSAQRADVPSALDAIVLRGLRRDADARYASALEMALALERAVGLASQSEIAAWLQALAAHRLAERAQALAAMQADARGQGAQPVAGAPTRTRRIEQATEPAPLPPSAAKQPGYWIFAAGALLGVLVALGYWFTRGPNATAQQHPSPPVLQPMAASLAATTVPPRAEEPREPREPEPPAPALPVIPAEPGKISRAPARAHTPRAPRARSDADGAPANPRCALFYEIDDHGIRRPKPECL